MSVLAKQYIDALEEAYNLYITRLETCRDIIDMHREDMEDDEEGKEDLANVCSNIEKHAENVENEYADVVDSIAALP